MQLAQFYHHHHLYRFARHPDFRFFELAIWLYALAHSLIGVFVPILLLQAGYSLQEVIMYYLIFNAIDIPLNFAVERLMRKIGARKVLILGTIALIAFFSVLGVLAAGNWPLLLLLAFLAAAYDTLFWISHFYIFIEVNKEGLDPGKAVGSLESVRKLAHIAGPAIGGFVLMTAGRPALAALSIAVFALSLVPLFRMRHVHDIPQEKKLSFREFFSDFRERKNYLSLAFWGVHSETDSTLWPLFIFLVVGTIGSVAAVPVIVAVTATAFSFVAGKLTKNYASKMIIIGASLIACAWVLRLTAEHSFLYYGTTFAVGLLALLVAIPIDGAIAARGIQVGSLAAATYRNTISMSLRVLLYLGLAILLEVFTASFTAAAASLLVLLFITLIFKSSVILKPRT